MNKKKFYSNGKLLITAEYVVLDGAKALAIPTKYGQDLIVEKTEDIKNKIIWKSIDYDGAPWFEDTITFDEISSKIKNENQQIVKNKLIEILHYAYLDNPLFLEKNLGYKITSHLSFPKNWGLGTSSTLINNIATWLNVNPYKLLENTFGGSGYDIACAQNNTPIIYQLTANKPIVKNVKFYPVYKEYIYFVYLNIKKSSKEALVDYYSKQQNAYKYIDKINAITQDILNSQRGSELAQLIEKHEYLMSDILETSTIKELLFNDFEGSIKSLGAWGGDFIMVVSKNNPKKYFEERGFTTILSYDEMVL